LLWPRPNRFTPENYDRIHKGMTQSEVEALLGPPGDYTTMDTDLGGTATMDVDHSGGQYRPVVWRSERANVFVHLNPRGEVVGKGYFPVQAVDHGPLGNVLWRAKRQWQKWFP
jgi:hypothetical protein